MSFEELFHNAPGFRPKPDFYLDNFIEFGTVAIPEDLTPEDWGRRVANARAWMHFASGEKRFNAAFFDTTTICSAHTLITEARTCLPETLLDLNTFVTGVVLFDHIFHLENPDIDSVELNEALGEPVIISLPVESFSASEAESGAANISDILQSIWFAGVVHYGQELWTSVNLRDLDGHALQRAWQDLLGVKIPIKQLFDPSVQTEQWSSNGSELTRELVAVGESLLDFEVRLTSQEISRFISECNCRSFFNLLISHWLQLPYLPNVFRLPFRSFLYSRGCTILNCFTKLCSDKASGAHQLVKRIELEYQRRINVYYAPDESNVVLPFFLAAVLNKVSSLSEFYEVLAETRAKATIFREHRKELDAACSRGDTQVVMRLREALDEDSRRLSNLIEPIGKTISAIAAILPLISSAPTPEVLATLTIIAASHYPSEKVRKLVERIFKPQFWFLANIAEISLRLTDQYPKIENLWGLPDDWRSHFLKRLSRLKALQYA